VWAAPSDALVDTGSPFTAIAPKDSERWQIPLSRLPRDSKLARIGFGVDFIPRLAHNVEVIFRDEDGERHPISYPLYALEPVIPRDKWGERVYRVPNVIGMDFLQHFRIKLQADPARSEVKLEFPE
jgi:hypothetical protein